MRAANVARMCVLLALCVAVAGCTRNPPQLMQTGRGQTTPDEFGILPSKPIEIPQDLSALPAPTPLVPNRTDVNPRAEAVAALGGNPSRVVQDGRLGADGTLIRQTTRYGIDPDVRVTLAEEDYAFRSRNRGRVMERLFGVPTYYRAYSRQELNQHGALETYRRQGVPTPAAPPDPEAE